MFNDNYNSDDSNNDGLSSGSIDYSIDEEIINGRYGTSPIHTNNTSSSGASGRDRDRSEADNDDDAAADNLSRQDQTLPIRGVQRMMFKSMTRSMEV